VPVPPPGVNYVEVACGYLCTLARRSDGVVVGWGDNSLGQCNVPGLPPGLSYVEIAAGLYSGQSSSTVARRSDGSVVTWGLDNWGQLEVPALPSGQVFEEISASGALTVARVGPGTSCASPTSYCVGATNTTGHGAHIGWQGSTSVAQNDLVLLANGCPPEHFGIFFFGSYQTQIPFGEGYLCVTGNQQRLMPPVQLDARGAGSFALDFTNPNAHESRITPGSEWNFQFWYRDPQPIGHGFNFTDALNAHFCP
jgi:hypothetical protein